MKKTLSFILLITIFFSCKKTNNENLQSTLNNPGALDIRESKLYVAKTLSKAVEKEPLLRSFIKQEALKQFDNENDVLYQTVKNTSLSDGESFSTKLSKYASNKDSLDAAIKSLPLLTIFVPSLPELTPDQWDAANVIPSVAVEPESYAVKEDVKAYYAEKVFSIPYGLIPSSATIVIKDNERVIVSGANVSYGKSSSNNSLMSVNRTNNSSSSFLSTDGMTFSYSDDVFDGTKQKKQTNSLKQTNGVNIAAKDRSDFASPVRTEDISKVQHLVDAVSSGAEWHRDNIYYGLNPGAGVTSGALKRNVKECLTAIRFDSGPGGYGAIGTAPSDPQPVQEGPIYQQWTNGSYEFRLTALINSKNGPGIQTQKVFFISPSQLFNLTYSKVTVPRGVPVSQGTYFWGPSVKSPNLYILPTPLPIDVWDLENVAYGWKIYLNKYNAQQTVVTTVGNSSEYATNFELSASIGEKIKIGPKFGATTKFTNTQSYSYTKVIGPAELGDANIYFSDPVILSYSISGNQVTYTPYELNLGSVFLTIEPRI